MGDEGEVTMGHGGKELIFALGGLEADWIEECFGLIPGSIRGFLFVKGENKGLRMRRDALAANPS
jgi:hypothetical protein